MLVVLGCLTNLTRLGVNAIMDDEVVLMEKTYWWSSLDMIRALLRSHLKCSGLLGVGYFLYKL